MRLRQVRNNIVVALTDMTVQYTALVDGHVPKLAACLADPHELVRRQALALLASLLSRVCTSFIFPPPTHHITLPSLHANLAPPFAAPSLALRLPACTAALADVLLRSQMRGG